MSLSLVLNNGSTIELADATFTKHYVVNCSDSADFAAKRALFTPSNLSDVKIYNDDIEVAHIADLELSGAQEVISPNETVTGHFYFGGGTVLPNEYEQAGKILLGEEETE